MLLDEAVVQEVITDLESELEKDAEKWAVSVDKVQWSARWVLDRIRVGVVKAREEFATIPRAEVATGWPSQTPTPLFAPKKGAFGMLMDRGLVALQLPIYTLIGGEE